MDHARSLRNAAAAVGIVLAGCGHEIVPNSCGGVVGPPEERVFVIRSDLDEPLSITCSTGLIEGHSFDAVPLEEQSRIALSMGALRGVFAEETHELAPRARASLPWPGERYGAARGPLVVQITVPAERFTRSFFARPGTWAFLRRDEQGALFLLVNGNVVPNITELPSCAPARVYEEPEKLLTARSTWKLGALRERKDEPDTYDIDAWIPARSTHFTIHLPKGAWPFTPMDDVRVRESSDRSVVLVGAAFTASVGEIPLLQGQRLDTPVGAFCTDPLLGIVRATDLVVDGHPSAPARASRERTRRARRSTSPSPRFTRRTCRSPETSTATTTSCSAS